VEKTEFSINVDCIMVIEDQDLFKTLKI